jgi:quinol monooxygenase YgiN
MEQFTLTVKFTAKKENQEQFKQELIKLFDIINEEENLVSAVIHQNIQKPEEFLVYEIWNDTVEHFLNVHLKKPYAQEWDQLLLDMDVLREPSIYVPFGKYGKENNNASL